LLSSVDTFSGISTLNGNGNILTFTTGGAIAINPNSTLYLTDVVLKNFGNSSFQFADTSGQIIMSNVTFDLAQNITTTIGNFYVAGPTTCVIKNNNWNFSLASTVTVDGVTLWTDLAGTTTPGFLTFGLSNLTLLNSGTVKAMDSTIIYCNYFQSEVNALNVRVGNLEQFTGYTSAMELWSPLVLSTVDTFSGISNLNGNGNVLTFAPGGQIHVGPSGVLNLTDVVLKNFGNTSFVFDDATGQIVMSGVTIELAQNVTTTVGNIYVNGPTTWIIQGYNWNFSGASLLTVDDITLWGETSGAPIRGNITYGPSNLVMVHTATIKYG